MGNQACSSPRPECFETISTAWGTRSGSRPWTSAQPCLESQPCGLDVACLKPFAAPGFARLLGRTLAGQGEPGPARRGMIDYRSSLDALGADCPFVGHDPTRERRLAFRRLLANWHGLAETAGPGQSLAELLFQERDWLLDPRPARSLHGPSNRRPGSQKDPMNASLRILVVLPLYGGSCPSGATASRPCASWAISWRSSRPPPLAIEQETFFNQLAAHCGKAFAGKVVSKDSADAAFS